LQENGGSEGDQSLVAGTVDAADHLLTVSSVSLGQTCHVCGRALLGLVRQGYVCQSMSTASLLLCLTCLSAIGVV